MLFNLFFVFVLFLCPKQVLAWENIGTNQVGFAYAEANVNTGQTLPSLTRSFVGFGEPFTLQRPINDVNGVILSFVRDMYFNVQASANLTAGNTYVLSLGIARPNTYVTRSLFNPYYHNDDITYIDLYDTSDGVGTVYHVATYNHNWNYDQWNQSNSSYVDAVSVYFTAPHNANYVRMLIGNRDETNTFIYANTWEGHTAQIKIVSASLINMGTGASGSDLTEISNQLNDINNNLNGVSNNIRDVKNSVDNVNNTLTNDNVDEAEDTAGDFFNDFMEDTDTHGLVGIIQAPLNLLRAINTNSNSCTALSVPLPFVNQSASLPCMKSVVDEHWPNFYGFIK